LGNLEKREDSEAESSDVAADFMHFFDWDKL
jgi:hypothetical protein